MLRGGDLRARARGSTVASRASLAETRSLLGAMRLRVLAPFDAPTGIAMTLLLATVAQAHGAALVGVAVIHWIAREPNARAGSAQAGGDRCAGDEQR